MPNNLKNFWESCNDNFAHLDIERLSTEKSINDYFNNIIDSLSIKDKTVIDYGVGGGVFAKKLLESNIKQYVGYDIAERQIKIAKRTLKEFENKEFHLVDNLPILCKADVFISLAVIQHFPDLEYYNAFMGLLNKSKIPVLYLQIRQANKLTFNNAEYTSNKNVRFSCYTNETDLKNKLSNYEVTYKSDIANNKYQHIIFKGV